MGYSPGGCKESDTTEQATLSLSFVSSGDGDIFFNRNQSQIFPKSIYRVLTVLTKVLGAFLTEIGKHFKINIEIELSGQNTL